MSGINAWWEQFPGERFWLGVTGRSGGRQVLTAPCSQHRRGPSRGHPLITHVKDGDVVFHYDEARRAIVAWSTSRGRVERRQIPWADPAGDPHSKGIVIPGWVIRLEDPVALERMVTLDEIARIQWDLFPALRAFEDRVGDPLHYPFLLGSPSETQLLSGSVFKLPGLLIGHVPAMEMVVRQYAWAGTARSRARAPSPNGTRRDGLPERAPIGVVPAGTGTHGAR